MFKGGRVVAVLPALELSFPCFPLAYRVIARLRTELVVDTGTRSLLIASNDQSRYRRQTPVTTSLADITAHRYQRSSFRVMSLYGGLRGGRLLTKLS